MDRIDEFEAKVQPLFDYNEYDEIIELCDAELSACVGDSDNKYVANIYYNKGYAESDLEQHEEAIDDFTKAIELNPDFVWAYSNRGYSKNALGLYKEAIDDFTKAIELKPDYANAYNNRANAQTALGQHQKAIDDYTMAIELAGENVYFYFNRGNAKYEL